MQICLFVVVVKHCANSSELFQDCLMVMLFALCLSYRASDCIYDTRCLFVAVGQLKARFIVLPHSDNMSKAHMVPSQSHYTDTRPTSYVLLFSIHTECLASSNHYHQSLWYDTVRDLNPRPPTPTKP